MSCTFVAQPADYSPPNESVIILVNDDTGAVFVDQEMMRQFINSQSSGTLNVVRLCGGKDPIDVNMTVEEICPTAFQEKLNLTDIVATLNKKTAAIKKEEVNATENVNEQVKETFTANVEPLKNVTENEEPANIVSEPANIIVSNLPIQDLSEVVSSEDNLPETSVVHPDYSSVEDVIESVIENSRNLLIVEPAAASPINAKEKRKLNKTEEGNKILKVEVERTAEEKKPQSRLSALRQEMQEKIQTIEPLKKEATPKANFKLKLQLKRVSAPFAPSPAAEPVKTPQHKIKAQNTPESLKNEESDGRRPKRDRKVPKHLLQDFEQFEGTPDYLKKLITSSTTHSPLNQTLENTQTPVRRQSESTPATIDEPKTVVSEESISDDDPTKLWCICRKPHNNRFMICCDKCEDWFHGHCVGVTRAMGRQLEENGLEWICPTCVQNENQKVVSQTAEEISQAEVKSPKPKAAAKKRSCVISLCKKDTKLGSIYCSDSCITSHVNDSLTLISKEIANHKTTDQTPKLKDSVEFSKLMSQVTPTSTKSKAIKKQSHGLPDDMTIPVRDPESGKIIEGSEAPKVSNIKTWLKKNPTYEIVRPAPRPEPSPQPAVQVSSPRKEAQKQTKPSKPLTGDDAMRSNARIALKEALVFRCRDCEDVRMTEDQATRAATDIEKALYKFFDKDVGTKYKAKYRSLLFNIRDLKNEVLFRKIAQNQIKPSDLMKMSADELASKELAEWRQRETKHQIEVIQKTELELGSTLKKYHVVKTHKGEEVIEDSVDPKPSEEPEATESLSLMLQDTTQKHRNHLFDLNCRICSGQVREEDVFPPDPANKDKEKDKNKAREVNRKSKDQGEKKLNKEENKSKEKEIEEVKQSVAAREEPSSTVYVKIAAGEESNYSPAVLWEGAVKSCEVGDFRVQAFEVSPNGHLDDARIPGSIEVIGRIRPPTLWDYINQNRKAGTRDIVLINMRPMEEADHTNFNTFLTYMHNSSRCGVIGSVSKLVKDFYVVPIPKGCEIPPTLAALAPATPALQSVGEGLLIGVVIRTKIQGPVTASVTTKPVTQPRVDQVPGQGVTYVPTSRDGTKRSLPDEDVANGAAKKSKTISETSQGLVGSSLLEQKAILDELNRKIEEQKKQLISMTAQLGDAAASAIVIPDLVLPGSGSQKGVGSDPTGNLQEILGAIEKKEQELKKLSLLIEKDPIVEKFGKLTEEDPEFAKDVDMRKIFASPNSMKQLNVDDRIRKRNANAGLDVVSNIPLPPQSPS